MSQTSSLSVIPSVSIGHYPTGALSIVIESDPHSVWPVEDYSAARLRGDGESLEEDENDSPGIAFSKTLGRCEELREDCFMRPNGFNVIPKEHACIKKVLQSVISALRVLFGEELEFELTNELQKFWI